MIKLKFETNAVSKINEYLYMIISEVSFQGEKQSGQFKRYFKNYCQNSIFKIISLE